MKRELTELVFILDKSGSMSGLERDTIGGFNSMIEKQLEVDGDCRITTVLFDSNYHVLHDRIDLRAIGKMTERDYQVGGCTALLDAMGTTIQKLINVQKQTAPEYRAHKVMFVIITDGEENSSREYDYAKVKKMVETEKEKYAWEFIFLGANIDAIKVAGSFGISPDRAVDYIPDSKGTKLNFQVMAKTVASYRSRGVVDSASFDEIREDKKKRCAQK